MIQWRKKSAMVPGPWWEYPPSEVGAVLGYFHIFCNTWTLKVAFHSRNVMQFSYNKLVVDRIILFTIDSEFNEFSFYFRFGDGAFLGRSEAPKAATCLWWMTRQMHANIVLTPLSQSVTLKECVSIYFYPSLITQGESSQSYSALWHGEWENIKEKYK